MAGEQNQSYVLVFISISSLDDVVLWCLSLLCVCSFLGIGPRLREGELVFSSSQILRESESLG